MLLAQRLLASGGIGLRYVGGKAANAGLGGSTYSLASLTGGIDTQPRAGDLVVVAAGGVDSADNNVQIGSGYTEVADLFQGYTNFAVAYKVMGSTPDTTVRLDSSDVIYGGYAVHVWRGVDPASPMDASATTALGSGIPNAPAITPATSGAVILALGAGNGGTDTASGFYTNYQLSPMKAPAGMGRVVSVGTSYASNPGFAFSIAIAAARWPGGEYNPAAFVGGVYANFTGSCAATLALRPRTS